ncbi:MAG TPA: methionine adenosyltransferase domain-containing protein, partial [Paracoccus solventivorans]|uniref:methionine adenosyltransferase domain-containing protein n=1 Tax=Paracoccus solventivorans TaxID=53463 RepID=UPI002C935439
YPVVAPVLLDDPAPPEGIAVELFGEPARLALPAVRSAWFATLVARPGGRDLLLEVTEIEGGRDGVVAPGLVASIERALREVMDLTPLGIRNHLDLCKPIYRRTAAYGHFGRQPEADGGFSWERTDLAEALKKAL